MNLMNNASETFDRLADKYGNIEMPFHQLIDAKDHPQLSAIELSIPKYFCCVKEIQWNYII